MSTARAEFLPFSRPCTSDEEIQEVAAAIRSGWVSTGPKAAEFEAEFAEYTSASHALALNSCTAGMHLALMALGVGEGDEVILPTLTFCATANVIVHVGATPVFVDVADDLNIDTDRVRDALTSKTKVIMPVHYGGQSCDVENIYEIAQENGLAVVEDGAHAVGTRYRGLPVGSDALTASRPELKRVTAFSFYATKNMTTGEGGMVTLADSDLADRIRLLALHGLSLSAWDRYSEAGSAKYDVPEPGFKYNMSDIQAAMGRVQLRRFPSLQERRLEIVLRYDEAFSGLDGLSLPDRRAYSEHAFHLYVVRVDADAGLNRDAFIEGMRRRNIGTSVHFPPVHLHSFYRRVYGYRAGDFPAAERAAAQIVSLPLFSCMSDKDVDDVVEAVRAVHDSTRKQKP